MKKVIALLSICMPFSTTPYVIKTAVDTLNPQLLYFIENQGAYTISINQKLKSHFMTKLNNQIHEAKELLHSPYSQAETVALVSTGLFFGASLYAIKLLIKEPFMSQSARYITLCGWFTISAISAGACMWLLNRSGIKGAIKRGKKLKALINKLET